MPRIRQIRDVIWQRGKDDRRQRLQEKEIEVQAIVGAIHGAAGNRRGVNAAKRFRMTPKEPVVASSSMIQRRFPVDPEYGLITPEDIAAEQQRLGLVAS